MHPSYKSSLRDAQVIYHEPVATLNANQSALRKRKLDIFGLLAKLQSQRDQQNLVVEAAKDDQHVRNVVTDRSDFSEFSIRRSNQKLFGQRIEADLEMANQLIAMRE